jgi:hypothetical protein
MTDLRITTTSGADAILEDAAVQALRANLHGPLLCPGDAGYDEARKVWNGMIDRRPALIARCAGVADVLAAVKFARTHEVLVSVRGGGHNAPGNAVCQGGIGQTGRHLLRRRRRQRCACCRDIALSHQDPRLTGQNRDRRRWPAAPG